MGCFERLVKSRFLANVSAELQMARQTLQLMSHSSMDIMLTFDVKDRIHIYETFSEENNILEEISESLSESDGIDYIYYAVVDDFVYAYSRSLKQLKEAVRYSYNLNGDMPLYMTNHIIDGVKVYTALIDTRIQFQPISPN